MSGLQENIQLTRQDIRSLEEEQKELKAELNNLKHHETPNYNIQHQQVTERLNAIGETLERKRAELEKLLQSQQLTMF